MRKVLAVLAATLVLGFSTAAAKPVRNVSSHRHPNIAAAQKLSQKAYERITAAQQANEFDMNGHAQKAKELLVQVNDEIKLAAEAANQNAK